MVAVSIQQVGCVEHDARRSRQFAHRQRDFGFGDDATCARNCLVRAETTRRPAQQLTRARVVGQLRHRDCAQRQGRRIIAQRDVFQRPQRITERQCAAGGGEKGVHGRTLARVFSHRGGAKANAITRSASRERRSVRLL